jgi:hypothetical protein
MTIKRLSSATLQLPSSVGTLYTCPAGKRASVIISLHNTNTSSEAVQLFWPGTASTQKKLAETLVGNETMHIEPKLPITLEAGETISGLSSVAAKVNVEITGAEETV